MARVTDPNDPALYADDDNQVPPDLTDAFHTAFHKRKREYERLFPEEVNDPYPDNLVHTAFGWVELPIRQTATDNPLSQVTGVIWHHGENSYSTDGVTFGTVPDAWHAVFQFFLENRRAMTRAEISTKSGRDNASQLAGEIKKKFPGFRTPGKSGKGRGYGADVRPAPRPA